MMSQTRHMVPEDYEVYVVQHQMPVSQDRSRLLAEEPSSPDDQTYEQPRYIQPAFVPAQQPSFAPLDYGAIQPASMPPYPVLPYQYVLPVAATATVQLEDSPTAVCPADAGASVVPPTCPTVAQAPSDECTVADNVPTFDEKAADFGRVAFHAAARCYVLTKRAVTKSACELKEFAARTEKTMVEENTTGKPIGRLSVSWAVTKSFAKTAYHDSKIVGKKSVDLVKRSYAELRNPEQRTVELAKAKKDWNEGVVMVAAAAKTIRFEWSRLGEIPLLT